MRTQTNNNITLQYPDEVGFAFNPCLLVASGADMSRMTIKISSAEREELVYMNAFKGKCYADVCEYVQSFFDADKFGNVDYENAEKTDMGMRLSFEIVTMLEGVTDDAAFSFEVFYIWGALKIGGQEVYNSFRTLTWFKGYPFTFGLYVNKGCSLLLYRDGIANRFVNLSEQGVWEVPMLHNDEGRDYYTVRDRTGDFVQMTFDDTFDMTFRNQSGEVGNELLRINIVEGYCGYYLRWVNRHGFYCYYLFKGGEEQTKTSSDNIFMRNNLLSYDMSYGYEGSGGRRQQMSREDTIPICAPLVDSDTWDMLLDITTSPHVDIFMGYKDNVPTWMSATIIASTYTKSKAVLQDFTCNMLMPTVNIQEL